MKRYLLPVVLLSLCLAPAVLSQNINGRFSSSLYSFERFDSTDVSATHLRSFQMLFLNVNQGDVSLRSYLNLENDFSEELTYDPRFRFYNLYLEARNIFDIATVKLGRQPIFNSVAGGLFDGITLDLKKNNYKFTAYYGGNVPAYQKFELTKNWSDDYILGGRFVTDVVEDFQFGLSYVKKNFYQQPYTATRLDAELNPIQVLIENASNQYQFASVDLHYVLENVIRIDSKFDYDINFMQASKFEIESRYSEIKDLGLSVYYNYREPKIRYNSIFSVFDYGSSQELEIGADYRIDGNFTVLAKFGNVEYKDDNSQRLTAGIITGWGTLNYRKTFGYAGELDAVSLYTARSFLDGLLTPSIGASYTNYKLSEDQESNDLTTILGGVNIRPFRILSFDLQGQYMNNKIYKDDLRFFFKINYWFNTNLNSM
ncbi:MAG: hypothetical protein Kow0098_25260 [Ignavibacteriaceae bacterium]